MYRVLENIRKSVCLPLFLALPDHATLLRHSTHCLALWKLQNAWFLPPIHISRPSIHARNVEPPRTPGLARGRSFVSGTATLQTLTKNVL